VSVKRRGAGDDFGQLGLSQRYLDDVDAEERGLRVGFRVAAGAAREYGVLVTAPGFEPFRGERISINEGADAALTVQLQIQRQTSSVTVSLSATAVSVDPTQNPGQIVLRGSDLDSFPTIPTTWLVSCKCWLDQVPASAGSLRGLAESPRPNPHDPADKNINDEPAANRAICANDGRSPRSCCSSGIRLEAAM
jgi:hypothetical protein